MSGSDLFDNVSSPVKDAAEWLAQDGNGEKIPQANAKFALAPDETAQAVILSMKLRSAAEKEKYDAFEEDEVVPCQYPTAVFVNQGNGVTIMQDQTATYGDREVMVVLASKHAVQAVIAALQSKLEEM